MDKENKIVLTADCNLVDQKARNELVKMYNELNERIRTINDRTKLHTHDIKELKKSVKPCTVSMNLHNKK